MALALTSFESLRAPNLLPADLSAPGHQRVFFPLLMLQALTYLRSQGLKINPQYSGALFLLTRADWVAGRHMN
jgi:hypothetical protein